MNLRHNKPAQSYSEPLTLPKSLKTDRIKTDPLLKLCAQQLVKFINRTNQKLNQYQKQQISKSKHKMPKHQDKGASFIKKLKKNQMDIISQSQSYFGTNSLKTYAGSQLQYDNNMTTELQSGTAQDNGQFQFQTLKQQWYTEPKNHVNTLLNMTRLCASQPKYYPILYRMHSEKYFIQHFHPEQLAPPNSLLVYRLLSIHSNKV